MASDMLSKQKFEYFRDICIIYKAIEKCEDREEIKIKVADLLAKFDRFRQDLKSLPAVDRRMEDLNDELDYYNNCIQARRKVLQDTLQLFRNFSTQEMDNLVSD